MKKLEMRIWERFPELVQAVKLDHDKADLFRVHDIFHALRVGEWAYRIAYSEWGDVRLAELAGIAGICHNADHMLFKKDGPDERSVKHDRIRTVIKRWLIYTDTKSNEQELIIQAVINHTNKNSDFDPKILIALMDADRVVNAEADVIMRSAQFRNLPPIDYKHFLKDPSATYWNPKTVIYDLSGCLDWFEEGCPVCVRTQLAKQEGGFLAAYLKRYLDTVEQQLKDIGLLPCPFDETWKVS
ncbi:MAG: HD domain-containing protein [Parcubacteria group bacterium]|nr:HD domain-containing protein [Parcubacteria group bacterium]